MKGMFRRRSGASNRPKCGKGNQNHLSVSGGYLYAGRAADKAVRVSFYQGEGLHQIAQEEWLQKLPSDYRCARLLCGCDGDISGGSAVPHHGDGSLGQYGAQDPL